ncbi:OFA family MFS transporter [Entomobacter blattae]|uniref:Putative MFS-type transporter YhjX n=1 Tax=Entomobacter blattae TaxID=2762277 RepID=A0A7H1NQ05_9PROT|nr:OFA family MFS transporter [Entomobacter blattae]QNT77865.1 putative MFS-type transporter YhjX [Entomobacter blattae]
MKRSKIFSLQDKSFISSPLVSIIMYKSHSHSSSTRWITLVATIFIQFCLGSAYTWSLYNQAFATRLNHPVSEVAFTFALLCLFLSLSSTVSGKLQDRIGTKKTAVLAGVMLGGSYVLSAFVPNLISLYLIAGVCVGCAEGVGYLPTLSNCVRWFPERKGMISAVVVGSYGLGSLGFKYINSYLLERFGLSGTFVVLGLLTGSVIALCALTLTDAPATDALAVENRAATSRTRSPAKRQYNLTECLHVRQYWMLTLIFLSSCIGGVFVLGTAKDLGQTLAGLSALSAAQGVAVIAATNLAGRLLMGYFSDKVKRIRVISFGQGLALLGLTLLVFFPLSKGVFFFAIACVVFNFGGTVSVYPALVGDYFGMNNVSKNYGGIYLCFGFGGIIGLIITSLLKDFTPTLLLAFVLTVVAFVTSFLVSPPDEGKKKWASSGKLNFTGKMQSSKI